LPLTLGVVDEFETRGLRIFGPNRNAAQLEGSKAFAKELMAESGIPTAAFGVFTEPNAAKNFVARHKNPLVVKADGLAAGKGVLICPTAAEAMHAIDEVLVKKAFGAAGEKIVIEEFLDGEEASFMALIDGEHALPLASSQDHKRVFDADQGPNTGGMGAYSPAPVVTAEVQEIILTRILSPLIATLARREIHYRGVLYVGLMVTRDGPKVLEFNARFGDPECQPLMLRLKSDLVELMEASIAGTLDRAVAEWRDQAAACIVLAARGYPGTYMRGQEIRGLEKLHGWTGGAVFHAGSARQNGRWLTNGGRVLNIAALGPDIRGAVDNAYAAVRQISWDGLHYRKDIGSRAFR
jgi:phosphoribosylamine--glycine ligase